MYRRKCVYKSCSFGCFSAFNHRARYAKLNDLPQQKLKSDKISNIHTNTDYSKLLSLFPSCNENNNNNINKKQ